MGKHARMYATTTLSMRGGYKPANIINNWCDEKLLKVSKIKSKRIWNPRMETKLQRLQQNGCN
jgi:hypothetical protein